MKTLSIRVEVEVDTDDTTHARAIGTDLAARAARAIEASASVTAIVHQASVLRLSSGAQW